MGSPPLREPLLSWSGLSSGPPSLLVPVPSAPRATPLPPHRRQPAPAGRRSFLPTRGMRWESVFRVPPRAIGEWLRTPLEAEAEDERTPHSPRAAWPSGGASGEGICPGGSAEEGHARGDHRYDRYGRDDRRHGSQRCGREHALAEVNPDLRHRDGPQRDHHKQHERPYSVRHRVPRTFRRCRLV